MGELGDILANLALIANKYNFTLDDTTLAHVLVKPAVVMELFYGDCSEEELQWASKLSMKLNSYNNNLKTIPFWRQ